jgi:hypothetical protein
MADPFYTSAVLIAAEAVCLDKEVVSIGQKAKKL